jgi:hypothetical protein
MHDAAIHFGKITWFAGNQFTLHGLFKEFATAG